MKRLFPFLLLFSLLWSCERNTSGEIRLTVSSWVGYMPLIYAREKGRLEDTSLHLHFVLSLGESVKMYRTGLIHGFASTQYEAAIARDPLLKPVILLDRSRGGDMILSSVSLDRLRRESRPIPVYMEIDSVNRLMFEDFRKKYDFPASKFHLVNQSQSSLSLMKPGKKPILLVSYEPFATNLKRNGFQVLASTRDTDLLVLDAIFVNEKVFLENREDFVRLKKEIDSSLEELKQNPRAFYDTVSLYLEGQSYEEFLRSIKMLEWLNGKPGPELRESLIRHEIPLDRILD